MEEKHTQTTIERPKAYIDSSISPREVLKFGPLSSEVTQQTLQEFVSKAVADPQFPDNTEIEQDPLEALENIAGYFFQRAPFVWGGSGKATIEKQSQAYAKILPRIRGQEWKVGRTPFAKPEVPRVLKSFSESSDCKFISSLLAYTLDYLKDSASRKYHVYFKQLKKGPHVGVLISFDDQDPMADSVIIDYRASTSGVTPVLVRHIDDAHKNAFAKQDLHLYPVNVDSLRKFDTSFLQHKGFHEDQIEWLEKNKQPADLKTRLLSLLRKKE